MALFRTHQGLYPYDIYKIEAAEIDKPDTNRKDQESFVHLREIMLRYANRNRAET